MLETPSADCMKCILSIFCRERASRLFSINDIASRYFDKRINPCSILSAFKRPKASQPCAPDNTALTASKSISSKLCFLQRLIRGSVIDSKCFKKVVLILENQCFVGHWFDHSYINNSIYNDLAVPL
jgi:hypothetical protein